MSTQFFPGASNPTFMQALLGQIVSAYGEARESNSLQEAVQNEDQEDDAGQDGQNDNDMEDHDDGGGHGGRNGGRGDGGSSKSRRKRNGGRGPEGNDSHNCGIAHEGDHGGSHGRHEEGLYNVTHSKLSGIEKQKERAHQDITLNGRKIPVATRSVNEQLAL